MRRAFVHEAALVLESGADPRAPGAAVTVGLCGHWEHEGACRWPHLSVVSRVDGRDLTLRVLFACEAQDEHEVRERIADALTRGRVDGAPLPSAWVLERAQPTELRDDERERADELANR
jgi:hypothetical protein